MSFLRDVAARIKGPGCQRSITRLASEISISGPGIEATGGVAKINVGLFSRKVVELVRATDAAVSLDEMQYQLCKTIYSTKDEAFKSTCSRIRLQIIISFHEFSKLIEAVKTDPSPETRKKLVEWMEYSSDLSKHAINALDPSSTERGVRAKHSLEDIAEYQKITNADMQEALDLLR